MRTQKDAYVNVTLMRLDWHVGPCKMAPGQNIPKERSVCIIMCGLTIE